MRNYTILIAMIMTATSPLFASSVHRSKDDTRCAVALAYIETVLSGESGKQVVFSDEWESVSFPMTASGWSTPNGKTRITAPPSPLVAEAKRRGGQSAIKYCPSVQTKLAAAGIAYGSKAVSAMANTARGRDFRYKMEIVWVSIPVVSRDQKKAVLYSSQASGPLAAGAYMYYMKRSAPGKWVVVGSKLLATA